MLTPEQRAEGQRLLEACNNVPDYDDFNDRYYDATDWLYKHAEALLAEPPAIDVEAIKRAAVREFAAALIAEYTANMNECLSASVLPNGYSANKLRQEANDWNERIVAVKNLAAARGVNLDEKP